MTVGGNYYSVPDRTRLIVEVERLPDLIRVIDRRHRTGRPASRPHERQVAMIGRIGDHVPIRSLAVYEAIGASLAMESRP